MSKKALTKDKKNGTVKTGARYRKAGDEQCHSEMRYPAIRKINVELHDFGNGKIERFAPDDDIAISWDILTEGGQKIRD